VQDRLGSDWLAIEPDAEVLGKAIPPALLESGVKVAPGAQVGSLVVLGRDVSVGEGSTVERSVVLAGSEIGARCELRDCIVGPRCRIGDGTSVTGGAVLGEGVELGADNVISRGARIFPEVRLGDGAIKF
jgi:mannose-1-phosphate guanylyltransferase